MKRIMSILLVLSILLVGCSGSSMSAVVTDTAPEYWSNTNKFAALLPIPNFPEGTLYTDTEDYYYCQVNNVSKKEYKAYADEVYKAGFDKDVMRTEDIFIGYIDSDTITRIDYYTEPSILSIIVCKKKDK